MGKHLRIAFDATPSTGAGVCCIYETGEPTQYTFYVKSHSYGPDPATFEMKNGINALKVFKQYFEREATVDIFCDNSAIDSVDHPQTVILKQQISQLEDYWECDIGVNHETVGDGNLLIEAVNELSRKRKEQFHEILTKRIGAKLMRGQ